MGTATFGRPVDWQEPVDYGRLRTDRLKRLKAHLDDSELGALLAFDFYNIRYMTATHIGTWAMDKLLRFALLPRGGEPVIWDFGSAARHHQLYNGWLEGRAHAGLSTLRGAMPPGAGRAEDVASKVYAVLAEYGLQNEPVGVDVAEWPVIAAMQDQGLTVTDGQQLFMNARRIKTDDEITLLSTATSMVDAAYVQLAEFLRPGVRENECVGLVSKVLYDLGSEHVEGVNAISGERCSPHPHVFSDRLIRPGDPAFFDILHSYQGYRTCYYRTFAVGGVSRAQWDAYQRCRDHIEQAIALVKPGATTADIVSVWPRAQEFGFANEEQAFGLQFLHGVGLSIHEKPIGSHLISHDHPEVLKEGMVLALETYEPADDGTAARLEEMVVVTRYGCKVITKYSLDKWVLDTPRYHFVGWEPPTRGVNPNPTTAPAPGGE
ncbi:M24 family metallopeptidase [Streptomyces sp. 7N604]|uniref:M24 family metallopeptidase n=1 Tax=Streptomyces sp. 7N604 TaxID=3457415 RepID=UPI003FD6BBC4